MESRVHFPGALLLQRVPFYRSEKVLPLLVQHVHPGFDAASNMLRATEQPLCYSEGFLQLVLSMASFESAPPRLWDVGASYGDRP